MGRRPGRPSSFKYCMLPWHQRRSRRENSKHGRRVLLPAAALLRQHAHLVAGPAHQRRLDLVVREHVAAERRLARQDRQVAVLAERARCARARCGPRTGRNRRSTRPSPWCRRACRGACRTGRCARRRSRDGTPTTRLCRMPSLGCACMMRTRRTIGVAGHQAVGVERQHEVEVAPQRSQKSRTLPALKPVLLGAAAIDDALRIADVAPPGGDGRLLGGGDRRARWCRSGRNRRSASPSPVASTLAFTVRRRRKARAGSSLRRVIRTAVRSRSGSR